MHYSLARRLRHLRQAVGLTRAEVARRAGLSHRTIENWEGGSREPLLLAAAKLARALECSLDDLVLTDTIPVAR